ncbi:o-acyltransferase wsd1 [Phtheirospermum japonicum]|uniref:O-acyltransferase wsd1 n=1 Tax=Phtheirospermum japonicum TaxID=374723 RepID=A0A830B8Q8_9LAMI|nr:o-acyltransferase wsd1 [Phtheirospermum japonicum]
MSTYSSKSWNERSLSILVSQVCLLQKRGSVANSRGKRTSVDMENHVSAPDLDPNMKSPDEFVEDFISETSKNPMDMTRPLWEFYILNVRTSKAISTVIFKIHHSMGGWCIFDISTHGMCQENIWIPFSYNISNQETKIQWDGNHEAIYERLGQHS